MPQRQRSSVSGLKSSRRKNLKRISAQPKIEFGKQLLVNVREHVCFVPGPGSHVLPVA